MWNLGQTAPGKGSFHYEDHLTVLNQVFNLKIIKRKSQYLTENTFKNVVCKTLAILLRPNKIC